MKFITIGDNVADCYLHENMYYPGGNAVNVAVNLKKCGAEFVEYIGIFGTDDMANHIEISLHKERIYTERCRKMIGVSGQPKVNIGEDGDRYFVGSRKDTVQRMVSLQLLEEEYEYLKEFELVHTSCYSSIDHLIPQIAKHIKVSYDFSDEHDFSKIRKLSPYLEYIFLSGSEMSDEEINECLNEFSKNNKIVCITLGSKGSICKSGGKVYRADLISVDVVDTMGAGDAYIAGFLYKHNEVKDVQLSMNYASEVAAQICQIKGGFGHPKALNLKE